MLRRSSESSVERKSFRTSMTGRPKPWRGWAWFRRDVPADGRAAAGDRGSGGRGVADRNRKGGCGTGSPIGPLPDRAALRHSCPAGGDQPGTHQGGGGSSIPWRPRGRICEKAEVVFQYSLVNYLKLLFIYVLVPILGMGAVELTIGVFSNRLSLVQQAGTDPVNL